MSTQVAKKLFTLEGSVLGHYLLAVRWYWLREVP